MSFGRSTNFSRRYECPKCGAPPHKNCRLQPGEFMHNERWESGLGKCFCERCQADDDWLNSPEVQEAARLETERKREGQRQRRAKARLA